MSGHRGQQHRSDLGVIRLVVERAIAWCHGMKMAMDPLGCTAIAVAVLVASTGQPNPGNP